MEVVVRGSDLPPTCILLQVLGRRTDWGTQTGESGEDQKNAKWPPCEIERRSRGWKHQRLPGTAARSRNSEATGPEVMLSQFDPGIVT